VPLQPSRPVADIGWRPYQNMLSKQGASLAVSQIFSFRHWYCGHSAFYVWVQNRSKTIVVINVKTLKLSPSLKADYVYHKF
jgi:hypothetical protein